MQSALSNASIKLSLKLFKKNSLNFNQEMQDSLYALIEAGEKL